MECWMMKINRKLSYRIQHKNQFFYIHENFLLNSQINQCCAHEAHLIVFYLESLIIGLKHIKK